MLRISGSPFLRLAGRSWLARTGVSNLGPCPGSIHALSRRVGGLCSFRCTCNGGGPRLRGPFVIGRERVPGDRTVAADRRGLPPPLPEGKKGSLMRPCGPESAAPGARAQPRCDADLIASRTVSHLYCVAHCPWPVVPFIAIAQQLLPVSSPIRTA